MNICDVHISLHVRNNRKESDLASSRSDSGVVPTAKHTTQPAIPPEATVGGANSRQSVPATDLVESSLCLPAAVEIQGFGTPALLAELAGICASWKLNARQQSAGDNLKKS